MPDSGKCAATIASAWATLKQVLEDKTYHDHRYVLLGDFNAHTGSARDGNQRHGQYGDTASPDTAGKHMLELLQAVNAYTLNSRQQGTNQTFYRGTTPVSTLDYAIVPEPLYKKGAKAAVTGSDWHITKSGHRVLLTELPLAAVPTHGC
jgi:endonuclease/exonuclease/phosphatase family metal-dependent hydrolase